MGGPVIITKRNQRANLKPAFLVASRSTTKFVFDHSGVFAMNHEERFLNLNAFGFIGKYREGIETEALEIVISLRVNHAGILIAGELESFFAHDQRFLQLR